MKILQGDALVRLREMEENSVDAIVTDPPYELGFMGKQWDKSGVAANVDLWREVLRVLKPGGHLLAFGGSRTYHRMACAIEDAGFEIRDQIMWIYGSGFPKSMNVGMAIDKAERGVPQGGADPTSANHGKFKGGCSEDNPSGRGFGAGPGQFMTEVGEKIERELIDNARRWGGWGTALKPSHEPICVARKSIEGTVAANVLRWGTGALDIDGCRVGTETVSTHSRGKNEAFPKRPGETTVAETGRVSDQRAGLSYEDRQGRWPANLIHDGSDEVLAAFPQAPGQIANASTNADAHKTKNCYGAMRRGSQEASRDSDNEGAVGFKMKPGARRLDQGSAARFFYCAKTSKAERGEGNTHPTVKPISLMRYLCRLVTPPSGVVLDPFTGSGSTGVAAIREGFDFIGIELNPDYIAMANNRILKELLS